jgi:hypothetical protein
LSADVDMYVDPFVDILGRKSKDQAKREDNEIRTFVSLENMAERWASTAPFLCLILDHRLCPEEVGREVDSARAFTRTRVWRGREGPATHSIMGRSIDVDIVRG